MNRLAITAVILALIVVASIVVYTSSRGGEIRVRATTTTSLYATGLLDYLAEKFSEKHHGVILEFIPVGSGEALRRAAGGDACMVLVHAPSLEKQYMSQGVIGEKHIFAYNYFILVGPASDPAGARGAGSVIEAFENIYHAGSEGKALFVSRGDNSGTHVRELMIWSRTGLDPHGREWYLETGSGMSNTLLVANEKKAYTLSDIGTFLKLKKDGRLPDLEILYMNGTELINVYSAYMVSSCSGREKSVAEEFIEFITSSEGQQLIASYGVDKYGQSLFYPAQGKLEWLEEAWQELSTG